MRNSSHECWSQQRNVSSKRELQLFGAKPGSEKVLIDVPEFVALSPAPPELTSSLVFHPLSVRIQSREGSTQAILIRASSTDK